MQLSDPHQVAYQHLVHFLLTHHSTIFFLFFSHLLARTNPTILMDAILWVLNLIIFVLSGFCIVFSHCTTQQAHHHCNNYHPVLFLQAIAPKTHQRYIAGSKSVQVLLCCTSLGNKYGSSYTTLLHIFWIWCFSETYFRL